MKLQKNLFGCLLWTAILYVIFQITLAVFGQVGLMLLVLAFLASRLVRKNEVEDWAQAQQLPAGDWVIDHNIFTPMGCQRVSRRISGGFEKLTPVIGVRTAEEVERIRLMIGEAKEGGFNWVTLYNPIGIPKEFEANANSTFTIQYRPVLETTESRRT